MHFNHCSMNSSQMWNHNCSMLNWCLLKSIKCLFTGIFIFNKVILIFHVNIFIGWPEVIDVLYYFILSKRGKKCTPTLKAQEPIRLSYGECLSVRLYRPNYCGGCADGRCCSPRRTRTVPVSFICPDGGRFQRSAMFIQSCKCSDDCGHLNEVALPPQHWMYGDTHKFID